MDISSWESYLLSNITSIAYSIILAILGLIFARFIRNKLLKFFSHGTKNQTLKLFFTNSIYTVVLVIVAIIVLGKLGVPTASLVTILGASSLAVALALKDFLSNIAAGVVLVLQRPFVIGDLVELSGTLGTVENIDLFNVKLKTPCNQVVYIPNGKLTKDKIVNKAYQGRRRLELLIDISYDADLKKAKDLIYSLIEQDPRVLKTPSPLVAVCELAESSVRLSVRIWVNRNDFNYIKFSLLENIKLLFDDQGISIPFSQMVVHLKQEPRYKPQKKLEKALEFEG